MVGPGRGNVGLSRAGIGEEGGSGQWTLSRREGVHGPAQERIGGRRMERRNGLSPNE
jgi:hypothetical protein